MPIQHLRFREPDQQPPLVDGFAFDPFSCLQDGLAAFEVEVGLCEIADDVVPWR